MEILCTSLGNTPFSLPLPSLLSPPHFQKTPHGVVMSNPRIFPVSLLILVLSSSFVKQAGKGVTWGEVQVCAGRISRRMSLILRAGCPGAAQLQHYLSGFHLVLRADSPSSCGTSRCSGRLSSTWLTALPIPQTFPHGNASISSGAVTASLGRGLGV